MFVAMSMGAVRFRLSDILKERGLKQVELAEKTGLHKQTISRLAGGVRAIELDTIGTLCEALEIQPGDLFEYVPTKKDVG